MVKVPFVATLGIEPVPARLVSHNSINNNNGCPSVSTMTICVMRVKNHGEVLPRQALIWACRPAFDRQSRWQVLHVKLVIEVLLCLRL